MKRSHASKHRSRRIIHISIQPSNTASLTKRNKISIKSHSTSNTKNTNQCQSSNLTTDSNKILSYRDRAQSMKDQLTNPGDDTKKHEQKSEKKKYVCQRNIIITTIVSFILIAILGIPLILLLPKSKTDSSSPVLRWNKIGITIAGVVNQSGNASNKLSLPWGLYIDWSNTLYITDFRNNRIQKYVRNTSFGETVAGDPTGLSGSTSNLLFFPTFVKTDLDGNVYVSDRQNNRVQLWNRGASVGTTIAGITGTSGSALNQLNSPYGIIHDPVQNGIFVADRGNDRIMYYRIGATNGTIVAGGNGQGVNNTQLYSPAGIYRDELSNSLIIANRDANNVVKWILGTSSWILIAGNLNGVVGNTANSFQTPTDVILDPMGNVYIVDYGNARVQFFVAGESAGKTIAGMTSVFGSNAFLLNYPGSIVLDNQLNLYVSDYRNHRVQKFMRY